MNVPGAAEKRRTRSLSRDKRLAPLNIHVPQPKNAFSVHSPQSVAQKRLTHREREKALDCRLDMSHRKLTHRSVSPGKRGKNCALADRPPFNLDTRVDEDEVDELTGKYIRKPAVANGGGMRPKREHSGNSPNGNSASAIRGVADPTEHWASTLRSAGGDKKKGWRY